MLQVDDPLKLLIKYEGFTGHDIQNWFMNAHIYLELADDYQALAICRYGIMMIRIYLIRFT